jgi:hypothetical protein
MKVRADKGTMTYQVKSWYGAAVPNVVSHPAVRSLAEKWFQITTERDPTLADFWHNADEAFVDNTILLLKGESDYTYLHHGRSLQQKIGFSMQGLRLVELRTKVRATLMQIYDRVTADFVLCYFQSFADFQQDVVLWGRLAIPVRLSTDDPRVAIVLYCHPIEDKASIYKALFERSSSGIVIAAPVKSGAGEIVDAWIIAQNEQAGHLTGVFEHATADLLLRHARIFRREDVWAYITAGLGQRATVATLTDQVAGYTINIYTELVDEYLVLRMTYVAPVNDTFLID